MPADFYLEGTPFYKRIIPQNGRNVPFLMMKRPEYIIVHETENYSTGADAWMHNRFVRNGGGAANVSFTYSVDDTCIIQNLNNLQVGWQAGDGFYGKGNRTGISIEMCEHRGSSRSKTERNTQSLIRYLMKLFGNITVYRIKPHKSFSSYSKNCPGNLLPRWNGFIQGVTSSASSVVSPVWAIKRGSTGERVKELQRNLKELGYNIGSAGVDGSFGPTTEKALKAFQKDRGIEVDGSYGPHSQKEMARALDEKNGKSDTSNNLGGGQWYVKRGDTGSKVRDMQSKLIKLGYDLGSSGADGSFGPATEKALKQFQKDRKIEVDGSYGPQTQKEMAKALDGKSDTSNDLGGGQWYVKRGDTGSKVKDMQRKLMKLGYDLGPSGDDGSFGPATEKALKQFQKDRKIEVDGSYGPQTQKEVAKALKELEEKPQEISKGEWFAVRGDKGPKIKDMQSKLIKLGYDLGSSGADGSFGPATEKAVKAFQKDRKIEVDGSYGPQTQEEVAEALEELKEKNYKEDKLSQEEKNMADTGFKDVDADKYYAGPIKRMAQRDIMSGITSNEFGVGKDLSRQDAAVLADRILEDVETQIEELKAEIRKALD